MKKCEVGSKLLVLKCCWCFGEITQTFVCVFYRMYSTIMTLEQRQMYQADFCAEYDEYKDLHSRIATITHMFVQLGSKIKSLSPGSKEYKVIYLKVEVTALFLFKNRLLWKHCSKILHYNVHF